MNIENVSIADVKPYEHNAKLHPAEQVAQIVKSIQEFGFNDPLALDGDGTIIEGHGRYLAAKKLGLETVPCIYLTHMSDEQKRAYILAHNKLTMNSGFDMVALQMELDAIGEIDMCQYGFEDNDPYEGEDVGAVTDDGGEIEKYTNVVNIPQYEPTCRTPALSELVSTERCDVFVAEIESSALDDEVKAFLKLAAQRHLRFDYAAIADYYANAEPSVQRLMERSALVIIDPEDAIANGYVKLKNALSAFATGGRW